MAGLVVVLLLIARKRLIRAEVPRVALAVLRAELARAVLRVAQIAHDLCACRARLLAEPVRILDDDVDGARGARPVLRRAADERKAFGVMPPSSRKSRFMCAWS